MQSIERDFPIEPLSQLAKLESWRKEINRPTYYVHKWWARRLGSVFRAILLGALLDESEDIWQQFYCPHNFENKIILDPFMGGGTTLGEAVKLGCRVIGNDINPVSWYLVHSALQRVNPTVLKRAFRRLEQEVEPKIRKYYRSTWNGEPADVLYAFWVKLIRCPGCQGVSRLFPNWIFSSDAYPKRKPKAQTLCPACGHIHVIHYQAQTATCPNCRYVYNPQTGPARRTTFICESCGQEHPIAETYRLSDGPPEHQLYALMLLLPGGRKVYKQPDTSDLALYAQAVTDWEQARQQGALYPGEKIPPGVNTDQARGYNYHYWHQMFNPRQLLCLSTLLKGILTESDQAVKEQFLLLFSGILEFNNMFCSFKGEGTGAVRPLFSHHILKPERTPLENNPWGTSKNSGSFATLFERRLLAAQKYANEPFELALTSQNGHAAGQKVYHINHPISVQPGKAFTDLAAGRAEALILSGDSASLPLPDGCVDAVITDPPYFDNVHYSELADFFYVWLKLALGDQVSYFSAASTRHPAEVQDTNAKSFEQGLAAVFAECRRVLKPEGLVIFTFQHAREEAWLALIGALARAGLQLTAAYPIKAEMAVATPKSQAKEPINIDIIFVCRPAGAAIRLVSETSVDQILAKTRQLATRLSAAGIKLSKGDLFVITMSQFVVAYVPADSKGISNTLLDEQMAILGELQSALAHFSVDDLVMEKEPSQMRQLRLLEEVPPYTAS
ncbi:MAG: DNA adenine methylase [Chloroflexi bacterium]|nr:DNA adenine methylase [Chloroflexota bacterium]MCI0643980.1 DNA adenine methylase [Chloroflexota bacterium]MCI0732021.1 DNA adenine methylase [Chloroflexota bacterium]